MSYMLMKKSAAGSVTRFIDAQSGTYPRILREITGGRKKTHWMWFVFPQLRALGKSETALYYGLADKAEAAAYIEHPLLRARLAECTLAILAHPRLMLSHPDNTKLQASMTLFREVVGDPTLPNAVLEKWFKGEPHQLTLDVLAGKKIVLPRSRPVVWHQPPLMARTPPARPSGEAMDRWEIEIFLAEFDLPPWKVSRIAEEWLRDRRCAVSTAWDDAHDAHL